MLMAKRLYTGSETSTAQEQRVLELWTSLQDDRKTGSRATSERQCS